VHYPIELGMLCRERFAGFLCLCERCLYPFSSKRHGAQPEARRIEMALAKAAATGAAAASPAP
jgi:hypothetical protein